MFCIRMFKLNWILIIILSGCRCFSVEENYFDAEGKGEQVIATVLEVDSSVMSGTCHLVIENKMIQYLVGDSYSCAVYNIKGDSLYYESKFMPQGNGPYEMQMPRLKYRPDKKELIIYSEDAGENDFYRVDLNDAGNLYNSQLWIKDRLPALPTRDCLEFIDDSIFIHSSYTKHNSLFSLSYKGRDYFYRGLNLPYPADKNNTDLLLKRFLFKGKLIKHSGRSTFLYSSEFFKYVIVFDLEKEEIRNIRYISDVQPDYKPVSGNPYHLFTFNKNAEDGCKVIFPTESYIYIGYNNMTWEDINNKVQFKGYPDSYFDRINVFDWEGNFVKRLVLDKPVRRFAVDAADKYLYASSIDLTQENQPDQVLRFELKGEIISIHRKDSGLKNLPPKQE